MTRNGTTMGLSPLHVCRLVLPILASATLVGCTEGMSDFSQGRGSSGGNTPITEAPCSETVKVFDSAGAAQPNLAISALPPGIYRHENTEVYIENKVGPTGNPTHVSRIQYLERETSNDPLVPTFVSGRRCKESKGTFVAYSSQIAASTEIKRYNNGLFDVKTRNYNLSFPDVFNSTFLATIGGDLRSTDEGTLASQIGSYWNGGYRFARRSGEVYELHGLRIETGRAIYGKVVYSRERLPSNSL